MFNLGDRVLVKDNNTEGVIVHKIGATKTIVVQYDNGQRRKLFETDVINLDTEPTIVLTKKQYYKKVDKLLGDISYNATQNNTNEILYETVINIASETLAKLREELFDNV